MQGITAKQKQEEISLLKKNKEEIGKNGRLYTPGKVAQNLIPSNFAFIGYVDPTHRLVARANMPTCQHDNMTT